MAPVCGLQPAPHVGHKPPARFSTVGTPPGKRRGFTDEISPVSKHTHSHRHTQSLPFVQPVSRVLVLHRAGDDKEVREDIQALSQWTHVKTPCHMKEAQILHCNVLQSQPKGPFLTQKLKVWKDAVPGIQVFAKCDVIKFFF